MIPAFGMVILPQNPSTGNRQISGWHCILSVVTCIYRVVRQGMMIVRDFPERRDGVVHVDTAVDVKQPVPAQPVFTYELRRGRSLATLKPEPRHVFGDRNCWEFHQAMPAKFEQEKSDSNRTD